MLAVAAITTVVFQRLRQPVVLGYIIAGLIVGPHVPIPLVADPGVVQTLSELGVILLMFSLGLEFSLRKLMAVVVLTAAVIIGKVVGVSLGAFLTGSGMRTSVQAGLSLAQIGEFSFIIAALGLALHATGEFLYPVAVAVSALTTLLTP